MPVVCVVLLDYNTTLAWEFYGLTQRDGERLNSYLIRADYGEVNQDPQVADKWTTPHFKAPRGLSRYDFANLLEQRFLTALTDEIGLTFNACRTSVEPKREETTNAPPGRGLPHQVSHFYFSRRPPAPVFNAPPPALQPAPFGGAVSSGGATSSTASLVGSSSSSTSAAGLNTNSGRVVRQEL